MINAVEEYKKQTIDAPRDFEEIIKDYETQLKRYVNIIWHPGLITNHVEHLIYKRQKARVDPMLAYYLNENLWV